MSLHFSVKTFSDVVETLLMWFGFCLPFNLHSVHLLWVKTEQQQDPRTVYHFLFKRPTQTAHPQSLQRPRWSQAPTADLQNMMFFILMLTLKHLEINSQNISACVWGHRQIPHTCGWCIWGQAYTCWWNKTPLREEMEEGSSLII